MKEQDIRELLKDYKSGLIEEDKAISIIKELQVRSVEKLGFAEIDHYREIRQGFPEVIYAAGKTKEQVLAIMESSMITMMYTIRSSLIRLM